MFQFESNLVLIHLAHCLVYSPASLPSFVLPFIWCTWQQVFPKLGGGIILLFLVVKPICKYFSIINKLLKLFSSLFYLALCIFFLMLCTPSLPSQLKLGYWIKLAHTTSNWAAETQWSKSDNNFEFGMSIWNPCPVILLNRGASEICQSLCSACIPVALLGFCDWGTYQCVPMLLLRTSVYFCVLVWKRIKTNWQTEGPWMAWI